MEMYQLLCELNKSIILGKEISQLEQNQAIKIFLSKVSSKIEISTFHKKMKSKEDSNPMYPLYFIPPYNNGKKPVVSQKEIAIYINYSK